MSDDFWKPYRESPKNAMPAITKARWIRRFQLGSYRAVVGTDCESVGTIYYTFVMFVFKDSEKQPCLAVTSEHVDGVGQDGSRCLCLFLGGKHFNTGVSQDWADLDKFMEKALELVVEALNISETPQEVTL